MSIDIEYAIKKDIRNNPVIRELDTRQKREFRRIVLLAGLGVGLLLFSARQHYEIRDRGYRIEQRRAELAREEITNRRLRLNLETSRAPQVIEQRARQELGLVTPSVAGTIVLERTRVAPFAAPVVVARAR